MQWLNSLDISMVMWSIFLYVNDSNGHNSNNNNNNNNDINNNNNNSNTNYDISLHFERKHQWNSL